jgi:ribosomal protein S19
MLFKDFLYKNKFKKEKVLSNLSFLGLPRNVEVEEDLVGVRFDVYNGKQKRSLLLKKGMAGFSIGSFVFTRPLGYMIHQLQKKGKRVSASKIIKKK